MANPSTVDTAGRTIAGLLTYDPGPGIYSRLERAVEAMPENVRVQELPGLLRRYKDGVPGWELKAADLDSVIAGRSVVPREELLSAVRERSPVYTHREVVLGGRPQAGREMVWPEDSSRPSYAGVIERQSEPSPLGGGVSHARPAYEDYGQGGKDYAEVLLLQPGAKGNDFGSHWPRDELTGETVAHARFDTHGDALRINELQSDLGIYNRRMREQAQESRRLLEERGVPVGSLGMDTTLPFPLEDAWADILIKRLALEAARKGHRAIEVASPRAIADKVGGNIDNYEHFYGKVVPGAIERLGRKMGGMAEEPPLPAAPPRRTTTGIHGATKELAREVAHALPDAFPGAARAVIAQRLARNLPAMANARPGELLDNFEYRVFYRDLGSVYGKQGVAREDIDRAMGLVTHAAERQRALNAAEREILAENQRPAPPRTPPPGRRYIMSDEMRRRILQEGIPAAVAIGIGTDQVLDRLNGQSPQPQMR